VRKLVFLLFVAITSSVLCAKPSPPAIRTISPISSVVGTQVSISGTHFSSKQGVVRFGDVSAKVISWQTKKIVVIVPSDAITGSITVSVPTHAGRLSSNAVQFKVTPVLADLSPTAGPAHVLVTIDGTGFGASQGNSTISFNGSPAIPVTWTSTSIVAPAPAIEGPIAVTVSVVRILSNPLNFTPMYSATSDGPALTLTSPASESTILDSSVTVTGSVQFGTSGLFLLTCNNNPASFLIPNFSCKVALNPGGNMILVRATDYSGKITIVKMYVNARYPLPPPKSLEITTSDTYLILGETNQYTVVDELRRIRMDATWTLSNTTAGKITSGSSPVFTAIHPGSVVLTAHVGPVSTQRHIAVSLSDDDPRWLKLSALKVGQKIQIAALDGRQFSGDFVRCSGGELVILDARVELLLMRLNVESVRLDENSSRRSKILLYKASRP
jgi:hypothetical protein